MWQAGEGRELFTTDTMVEGIHFTRETTPWRDLGWKAIAANISDVASMGGMPTYALITLGLPPATVVEDIEETYRGMLEIGDKYGMAIVGGDIVGSPALFITTALVGVTETDPLVRSTARPGDVVGVTGYVGSSGGGLRLMLERMYQSGEFADYLRAAHRRPLPAVEQGQLLAAAGIRTAMDVSDGLADDLGKLCSASGVTARVRASAVPAHPALRRLFPDDYLSPGIGRRRGHTCSCSPGPPDLAEPLVAQFGEGSAIIGEIEPVGADDVPGKVLVVDDDGEEIALDNRGWDHLGGGSN